MFQGYEYRQKGRNAAETVQFWQCVKNVILSHFYLIHFRAVLGERIRILVRKIYVLLVIITIPKWKRSMLFVNEKSKLSTKLILEKTREIIARAFHELNDEELMAMPSCSTAQRMLQRKREHPEAAQINAKEVHNIVIEGDYANDEEGHQFLLYDSRNHAPDDAVFFIFATQMGIIRLRTYRHWSGDGTFKITPSNFLQLYTLNVLVEQSSVPSAYILMCNKAADTYRRIFEY